MRKFVLIFIVLFNNYLVHAKVRLPAIERIHKKLESALDQANAVSGKDFMQLVHSGALASEAHVHEIMKNLYWSNQVNLVSDLNQFKKDTVRKALEHLMSKIFERYINTEYPLFKFLEDLNNEESTLNNIENMLVKKVKNPLVSQSKRDELGSNIQAHAVLSKTLRELFSIVHDLLINRS